MEDREASQREECLIRARNRVNERERRTIRHLELKLHYSHAASSLSHYKKGLPCAISLRHYCFAAHTSHATLCIYPAMPTTL
jgi:hypothetical protein